jgi:hypothetical protein
MSPIEQSPNESPTMSPIEQSPIDEIPNASPTMIPIDDSPDKSSTSQPN